MRRCGSRVGAHGLVDGADLVELRMACRADLGDLGRQRTVKRQFGVEVGVMRGLEMVDQRPGCQGRYAGVGSGASAASTAPVSIPRSAHASLSPVGPPQQ